MLGTSVAQELFQFSSTNSNSHDESGKFNPSAFLIPGWEGGSLASKSSLYLKKVQKSLFNDALSQFWKMPNFNESLKRNIHRQYVNFSQSYELDLDDLEREEVFWKHVYDSFSPHRRELDIFIKKFCLKAVNLYIYKVKFVATLASENLAPMTHNSLINPHSFFTKIFRFGGSRDLMCEALQRNTYSWYHPSEHCEQIIVQDINSFVQISTSELMLLSRLSLEGEEEELISGKQYSHTLSHKLLGLLLNNFMIFFPIWKGRERFTYPLPLKGGHPEILNTKFEGDFVGSLTYSHWLAQECNQSMLWSEILCPGFVDEHFENGDFLRYCHELQFLIFLTSYSKKYESHPLDFITNVMREKYNKSEEMLSGQPSLFTRYNLKRKLLYDRIVLSVCSLPEKNPHHFLLNKIQHQVKFLTSNGYLLVMSNQNLFIASQSARVHQLMEGLQLEFYLNLEELQGKGEIPHYIYVFFKKSSKSGKDGADRKNVHFHTLQWSGDLAPFEKFKGFLDELHTFLREKNPVSTPIYQKDLNGGLCFKFQQDAVLEGGLLLSSTTKDSGRITHPNFFKNLTQTCSPLDQFFAIEQLGDSAPSEIKQAFRVGLLGVSIQREQQFPHVLIVNYSHDFQIDLEIISSKSYKAKLKKYGQAFYQYFGLSPKIAGIDINLFREFFLTSLGRQVIQISLQGGMKKSKAKLKSLLIPNIFARSIELEGGLDEKEHFLYLKSKEIRRLHPEEIVRQWFQCKETLFADNVLSHHFQMHILSRFKHQIANAISPSAWVDDKVDFNNEIIKKPLLELKYLSIYPKSEDVYIKFLTGNMEDLQKPCEEFALEMDTEEGGASLSLMTAQKEVRVRLYSEPAYLEFVHYVLSSVKGRSFAFLIKNLRLPRLDDFKEVLRNYGMMDESLREVHEDVQTFLEQIIVRQFALP